ncbi:MULTISPECIES: hypothetical protein [unclassified Breznakia]|uniref:hypothetical protein n=1 Tax=unclassified Breznakia TaxID=2623764 RepID=UPI0024763999|nr:MULTISPECIES: hypothetical protein [unclassified Breznakia]MDH6366074.1 di/tripeptidase [Breznakia sp. PH1-1]MDH6402994.1 di/tripeptidase [Breznakia sp. PF1-11]MDH6410703.1 di/tripeptidase [Breznakia sp. PFB1-11]MDH6413240.1 di/tripeptidase [Breznakia sp. PFB1-14]MDH6415608.1 di/tripeptidase [Breznakia sp. PFB1-4]
MRDMFRRFGLTAFIIFLLLIIIVSFMGIFVSGPVMKNEEVNQNIISKIETKNKACEQVVRHSFRYVTFTCESDSAYTIYDENAKKIASRKKSDVDFQKANEIAQTYDEFKDVRVEIGYGYEGVAYVAEVGSTMLIIDFDSYEVLFYNGGQR